MATCGGAQLKSPVHNCPAKIEHWPANFQCQIALHQTHQADLEGHGPVGQLRAGDPPDLRRVGRHCCYWNRYRTQRSHPAQGLSPPGPRTPAGWISMLLLGWLRNGTQRSHPARGQPAFEPGGSACCYWNRYRTQCNHPAAPTCWNSQFEVPCK